MGLQIMDIYIISFGALERRGYRIYSFGQALQKQDALKGILLSLSSTPLYNIYRQLLYIYTLIYRATCL